MTARGLSLQLFILQPRRMVAFSLNGDQPSSHVHKREPSHRIFVNRGLRLEKIQFFGFDMDYTLVEYKSPETEILAFDLAVRRLVAIGYPEDIAKFSYDPIFPVRGLWFDYQYGNLLKVDGFGNILQAMHGLKWLKAPEIEKMYPNKYLQLREDRVFVLNTLFNLPETHLIAQLIEYFDTQPTYTALEDRTGVAAGEILMSYKSIFLDVRAVIDWVHIESDMKTTIMNNPAKYVEKDERAAPMLKQLRQFDKQTFLLTNSDWAYTDKMMTFVLGDSWRSYFNTIVVDARKPKWFGNGTVFREVNTTTGAHKLGIYTGLLKEGVVYSGGSSDAWHKIVKARGKDVLYIGDHIFGDVLRSKKSRGWRTFLVVPELDRELKVWTDRNLFDQLATLESTLADLYKDLDATSIQRPDVCQIIQDIRAKSHEMDQEYGVMGSLFRAGSRTTFFSSQVERYADIYASSCYNLLHYPSFYLFRAPMQLMPHESTVDHASTITSNRWDSFKRQESVGNQVRGWAKKTANNDSEFFHEEEDDEDQSNSDVDVKGKHRVHEHSISEDSNESLAETDVVAMAPEYVEPEEMA